MEYKKLLAAGLAALMIAGCGSTSDGEGDASAKEDAAAEVAKAEETKPKEKPGVGETVTVDGAAITINSAETVDQVDDMVNTAANLEEGKKYVVIDMTIANDSDEELKISSMVSFELKMVMEGNRIINSLLEPTDRWTAISPPVTSCPGSWFTWRMQTVSWI